MYSNLHGWLLFVVVEWKFLDKLYQEASLERVRAAVLLGGYTLSHVEGLIYNGQTNMERRQRAYAYLCDILSHIKGLIMDKHGLSI